MDSQGKRVHHLLSLIVSVSVARDVIPRPRPRVRCAHTPPHQASNCGDVAGCEVGGRHRATLSGRPPPRERTSWTVQMKGICGMLSNILKNIRSLHKHLFRLRGTTEEVVETALQLFEGSDQRSGFLRGSPVF